MSSMDYIPFAVAQKQGVYDSLGLKLNFIRFFSANERDLAFRSGKIDGAITDLTGAITQQANGLKLKIVMKNDGIFYLIVKAESNIKALTDLRQTNIGVSENTVTEFSTDMALQSANILSVNVNKPEINKIPLRLEMLENGQIDASFLPDPYATIAKKEGLKSLTTTQKLGISATETIFSESAIKEKRKEIKALIQGYNLGVDYIKTHPQKKWNKVLADQCEVSESLAGQIPIPNYQQAKLPENKDIKASIIWLKIKQLIPENYNEKDLIDSSFVKNK